MRSISRNLVAAAAVVALVGCASTTIKDSWKDPAHAGGAFKKVLVVGVSKSDSSRRIFEDGFTSALRAAGTSASPSYPVLPESGQISNERLEEGVKKSGADAVLVTRLLRVKKDMNVSPGYVSPGFYGRGYRGYYGGAYMAVPGHVDVYDVLTIESTLWNMKTDKPAWSGTSEVTDPGSVAKATEELAKVLIGKMKADGVIYVTLDPLQSLLAALACLLLGAAVNRKVWFLSKYNIPDPITGGLLFAAVISLVMAVSTFKFSLNVTLKPTLLLMFFAGVGMSADLRLLKQGGKALAIFMVVLFPFILVQNLAGIAVASALDLHPLYGIIVGSITLVGGHGTGAAYAERFAEVNNLQSVMELSMTSATIGLILGGIVAGPVAQYLITKHKLKSTAKDDSDPGSVQSAQAAISTLGTVGAFMGILTAVIAGQWIAQNVKLPITIPGFLWCMMIGVAIRNLVPFAGLNFDDRASDLLSGVSLSLFLVMTMMALNLVEVALSAGPLLVILAVQTVVISAYAIFVTFRFMGRDYEAATTSAAFIGFNMGSTATAIANMQAITAKYGPAPKSFLIVPLAGAFFVDLLNALILTGFLSLGFLGGGP